MTKRAIITAVEQLEACGMRRCGSFLGSYVLQFSADDEKEYLRFFSPQFISKDGGKALVGLLGSMKREIINDWSSINRIADYFVLSAFSANFVDLRDPPIFGAGPASDIEWCKRIVKVLESFPTTRCALDRLNAEGALIGGFEVAKMA